MSWGIGIIVAVLALGWIYAHRISVTGSVTSTTPITVTDPSMLQGMQTGDAPWTSGVDGVSARLAADSLPQLTTEGEVLHIHQHIDIYVNGHPVPVPADIGVSSQWISPIHVHDTSGVIHIESPYMASFTLGEFFDVWGVRLTSTALGGYTTDATHTLKVYVNGQLSEGDPRLLTLVAHQEIVVVYGTDAQAPQTIPTTYNFPLGE